MPSREVSLAEYLTWVAAYVAEWGGRVPNEFEMALSVLTRKAGTSVRLRGEALRMLALVLERSTTEKARVVSTYWQGKAHLGVKLATSASEAFLKALVSAPQADEEVWRTTLLGHLGFCVLKGGNVERQKELTARAIGELEAKGWLVPDEFRELPQALEDPSPLARDLAMFRFCSRVLCAYTEGTERVADEEIVTGCEFELEYGQRREQVLKQLLDGGLKGASLDLTREALSSPLNGARHLGESLLLLACVAAVLEDTTTAEALFEAASESYRSCGDAGHVGLGDSLVARALLQHRSGDSGAALKVLDQARGLDTGADSAVLRVNALIMIADIHEEQGDFQLAHAALEEAATLRVALQPPEYLDVLEKSLACREALLNGTAKPRVPFPARSGFAPFIYRNKLVLMAETLRGRHLDGLRMGRETLLGRGGIPTLEDVAILGGGVELSYGWGHSASSKIVRAGAVYENAGMRREALRYYLLGLKVLDWRDCPVAPDDIRRLEDALELTRRDQRLLQAAAELRTPGVPVTGPRWSAALGQVVCKRGQGDILLRVGFNRLEEGAVDEAVAWFERVRVIGDETHSQRLIALSQCGLGVALQCRTDDAEPRTELAEAAAIAETVKDSGVVGFVNLQLCRCLVQSGKAKEVLIALRGLLAPGSRVGNFAAQAWGTAYLGAALRLTRQPEEAVGKLMDADDLLGRLGSVRGRALTLAHKSLALASLDREKEARTAFDEYGQLRHRAGAFLLDRTTIDELASAFSLP